MYGYEEKIRFVRPMSEIANLKQPAPTFKSKITISHEDIDQQDHVNNAVYLRWVQEAVLKYWHHIAPMEAATSLLWVALAHHITYRQPVFLGDQVHAMVAATSARGARAAFTTLINRGDLICAEIHSSWCCVDSTTRRPRRLADGIAQIILPN